MGIQINGQTDRITAVDGSFSIQDLAEVNVTGVATASNFKTGTSNVHSTGYECANINATGIVTAASANFTGNVSIGGTLTYQDVTNIDSVGVVTARTGIVVSAGHINLPTGYSLNWSDTHERIEQSDAKLKFFTNNTEKLTLSGSNLGIGTDNPDATLKVNVASGNNGVVVQNTSTANIALFGARNGDATVQIGQWGSTASGTTFGLSNADLSFIYTTSYSTTHPSALALGTVSNKPIVFATNNTERVRIDSSGNMQVSTGQFTVGTTASTGLQLINDGTFGTIQSADLKIRTASTERMRIDSSGHIRFGSSGTGYDSAWSHSVYGNTEVAIDGGGGYGVLHFRGDGAGSVNTRYSMGVGDENFYMCYDDVNARHNILVNGSGYVTKPQQPGIYLDALDWSSSNNYMHNGYQFWQTGNHWNNSTGTFTCPVAGKYLVAADAQGHNTHLQTGASAQYANLVPRVNNANVGLESVATTREDGTGNGGTATHTSFGFTIILSCNANDTIRVHSNHGFRSNTQNHLTIYLLG